MHIGPMRTGGMAFLLAVLLLASASPLPGDVAQDDRIKQRILGRLAGQVSLSPQGLQISVTNGAVRLSGSVGSLGERRTLERLVGGMTGVTSVSNDLTIRMSQRSQADIIQEILGLLEQRPRFRSSPISMTATGGEVTLHGTVERSLDRVDAEIIASGVEGVTGVVNLITVRTEGEVPPQKIRARVTSILSNRLTFGVIRDLVVEVSAGTVTLHGLAIRDQDRVVAERLALSVTGVARVENRITILGS